MAPKLLGPVPPAAGDAMTLESVLLSPPTFSWDRGRFGEEHTYCYVPSVGRELPFYVSSTGFHYHDPDNSLLRYERTEEGFILMEIKKRKGISFMPECPVILPVQSCSEEHSLLIAYYIDCRDACTYRAVVFDAFHPIRIIPNDPALVQIMRHLMNRSNILNKDNISITYEEFGVLDDTQTSWKKYVEGRMGFIYDKVGRTARVSIE